MSKNASDTLPPTRNDAWKMFDRIAHRYDLLNHLLSFGQDLLWRAAVAKCLANHQGQHIVDIATGTADQLIAIFRKLGRNHTAIGLDMSAEMLTIGRSKVIKQGLNQHITLVHSDALRLPLQSHSVDAVTITFGIRNLVDMDQGLQEMNRILKADGQVIILEFSLPGNRLFRSLYLFYFRNILPTIGSLISGDNYAYRYLNKTVETFPYGDDFCRIMNSAGFARTSTKQLNFGIATIYRGWKEKM